MIRTKLIRILLLAEVAADESEGGGEEEIRGIQKSILINGKILRVCKL